MSQNACVPCRHRLQLCVPSVCLRRFAPRRSRARFVVLACARHSESAQRHGFAGGRLTTPSKQSTSVRHRPCLRLCRRLRLRLRKWLCLRRRVRRRVRFCIGLVSDKGAVVIVTVLVLIVCAVLSDAFYSLYVTVVMFAASRLIRWVEVRALRVQLPAWQNRVVVSKKQILIRAALGRGQLPGHDGAS